MCHPDDAMRRHALRNTRRRMVVTVGERTAANRQVDVSLTVASATRWSMVRV